MQFTLDLDSNSQRPVVLLKNFYNISALLDTGSYFPVWTDDEEILVSLLNASFIKKNIIFGGFGGQAKGNLYTLNLNLGKLIFPNMYIIACNSLDVPFNMILSATMFRNLMYEIDDVHHKLNVTIPNNESNIRNLIIEDKSGKLHILYNNKTN